MKFPSLPSTPKTPGAKRRGTRTIAAVGAAAVVSALALTGCGSGAGSSSGGSSKEITVWHYFSDPNQVKVMTDYADTFQKNNPGTKVNNVYVPYDQLDSKLIASAGAKSGPDVVVYNGADASNLALANTLAPLDDKWGTFADKSQFPESVVHKVNGKTYGVQGYVNLLGLWYNKDILTSLGVQPPKTLSELEDAMGKAVAAGKQGMTLSGLPQSQGEWQAFPWLSSAGFSYGSPDAGALEKGLGMAQDWVKKGYVSKEAVTWDQTVPFQKFAAGNVAFAENGNWQMGTAKSTAKFSYGVVPLPVGSGKVYLGGEAEGIGAFSKNPDLAWKYLQQTYFDKAGQLTAMKDAGSIPSRKDSAADPAVTGNDLLKPFADSIAKNGATYPDDAVPAKNVANVQLAVGQAWSAALGGQSSPSDAAQALNSKLSSLLQK
ncbi:sugar ABC transporter substrate-binding protein [Paenarthrobacter sp. DKR-5]|uniref:sugar ABC transporter substrate-binding protein n=1 Tax=Paenarthrobacter sp. DKR-5 TaxID=2835535 RepID=UPI001BDCB19E|nr:sugar ABC transporter substrate-binding protein [Paenarthrobacter sp. DKR-5]MBT1001576.1 sugar ABC transporter substrate-binding protein [Paenarthrobacter sp. DKR-5]